MDELLDFLRAFLRDLGAALRDVAEAMGELFAEAGSILREAGRLMAEALHGLQAFARPVERDDGTHRVITIPPRTTVHFEGGSVYTNPGEQTISYALPPGGAEPVRMVRERPSMPGSWEADGFRNEVFVEGSGSILDRRLSSWTVDARRLLA